MDSRAATGVSVKHRPPKFWLPRATQPPLLACPCPPLPVPLQALDGSRRQGGDARAAKVMRKSIKDIVCAYAYPRLDMEVSKKMNHLLKVGGCSSLGLD